MKYSPPSQVGKVPPSMTVQRLQQLLDAYGAEAERWPPEEREAALALLAHSTEAQVQQDKAARLDALLDLAPVAQPSTELAARILAAAITPDTPDENLGDGSVRVLRSERQHRARTARRTGTREKSRWVRRWPALAIAASLAAVFWSVRTMTTPPRPELSSEVIASLGVYYTSTDVLLQSPVAIFPTTPSVGCMESELGCPDLTSSPEVESQSRALERKYV
jgi:hypothetical protein